MKRSGMLALASAILIGALGAGTRADAAGSAARRMVEAVVSSWHSCLLEQSSIRRRRGAQVQDAIDRGFDLCFDHQMAAERVLDRLYGSEAAVRRPTAIQGLRTTLRHDLTRELSSTAAPAPTRSIANDAFVRGVLGPSLNASAATAPGQKYPPAIEHAVASSLATCKNPQKGKLVEKKDVNGDGVDDFVIDLGGVRHCEGTVGMPFCGSAGCETQVWVSDRGTFRKVFDDVVGSLEFRKVDGRRAEIIGWSGVVCGRSNADPCSETRYWNGATFSAAH